QILQSRHELKAYLGEVIADRRKAPRDDLLSYMLEASEGGTKLTPEEVSSLASLLLVAGNETTTKLIGLMMNQLLRTPSALRTIGESTGLIPGAVEETVRIEGPVYALPRRVTRDCSVAGVAVRADT